jgi:hypothetical protein
LTTKAVDTTEAVKRLRLFNEKAKELRSYSFIEKAFHKDAGVTINFDLENKTVEATRVGADNEARAAACLILRLFLLERDHIKLHQIAELYQSIPVKDEDKHWVSENLKELDKFLDGVPTTQLKMNGKPMAVTHREVLEIFLYGDVAHLNAEKRIVFETWKEVEVIHIYLENLFEYVVGNVIRYIFWLAAMNIEAIGALEQVSLAS